MKPAHTFSCIAAVALLLCGLLAANAPARNAQRGPERPHANPSPDTNADPNADPNPKPKPNPNPNADPKPNPNPKPKPNPNPNADPKPNPNPNPKPNHDKPVPTPPVTPPATTQAWWLAPSANGAIEGYADQVSALPGDKVALRINVPDGSNYSLRVYRLDASDSGGTELGCRPACATPHAGIAQPAATTDPITHEIRAPWSITDTIMIGRRWQSGYYVVQFVLTSGANSGQTGWTPLIIRRSPALPPARVLVEIPISTWQMYNTWGGLSAYSGGPWSDVVSFDRPYAGGLLGWEYPLVRYLAREGLDVSYQTDLDTNNDPASLLQHRLVIVNGHDEYWTAATSKAFYSARRAGVNLAFFGANIGYWRTRTQENGRALANYKHGGDPIVDPALTTGYFRDTKPECRLLGVQHQGGLMRWPEGGYTVDASGLSSPWFAGTGLIAGSTLPGIVSTEVDTIPNSFESLGQTCVPRMTTLFRRDMGGDTLGDARAVTYVSRSGAKVFSAGSLNFSWGLDDIWQRWMGQPSLVDPRLQRFVHNMLQDLAGS